MPTSIAIKLIGNEKKDKDGKEAHQDIPNGYTNFYA